jgi:hypothetical protein
MTRLLLFLFLLILSGCATYQNTSPQSIQDRYLKQILEWQQRIEKEGWNESAVDGVIQGSIDLSSYAPDKVDHWDTPAEFIRNGFRGDCEDFAAFMMFNLKRLKYPEKVRILAVRTLMGDHAVLKVAMPGGGRWKIYETLPRPFDSLDQMFYRPIFEFDERLVVFSDGTIFQRGLPVSLQSRLGSSN